MSVLRSIVPGPTELPPVGFTAFPDVTRLYSEREAVLFREVTFNSGDAFDADTSAFTCPTFGVYIFTLVYTQRATSARLHIMKETDVLFTLVADQSHAVAAPTWSTSSGTVVVQCDSGQRVWVQSNTSGQVFSQNNRLKHTVFVGFLLSKL